MKIILKSLQKNPVEVEISEEATVKELLKIESKSSLCPFIIINGNIVPSETSILDLPKLDYYLVLHRNNKDTQSYLEDSVIQGGLNVESTYQTMLGSLSNSEDNPIIEEIQNIISAYSTIPINIDNGNETNPTPLITPNNNTIYNNLVQQLGDILLTNTVQPNDNPSDSDLVPVNPISNVLNNVSTSDTTSILEETPLEQDYSTSLESENTIITQNLSDLAQLRITYISQLNNMKDMGFQQEDTNLQALIINSGNLENSVNWILNLN
jgi:hypothetical protein